MGGRWQHRQNRAAHQRARLALLPSVQWGLTPCSRCEHPLEPGDQIDLDHADDGSYRGFSHRSACRVCNRKCNQAAGGESAALKAGKRLRARRCVICGLPFRASESGTDTATCGRRPCLTELKRRRKNREPDPEPPPQTGRIW